MNESQPPKSQNQEKSLSPSERIRSILNIFFGANASLESMQAIQEEIVVRVKYLRNKYPDHANRKLLHVLSGSTLNPSSEVYRG